MRRIVFILALILAGTSFAPRRASALSFKNIFGEQKPDTFSLIHVQDLVRLMNDSSSRVYVFDANPGDVRQREGMIPGARLLDSDDQYDVANTLPKDKNAKIIFYCHDVR